MSANTGKRRRSKWLQVRVSADELATVKKLANLYDLDYSDLIRHMIRVVKDLRPVLPVAEKPADWCDSREIRKSVGGRAWAEIRASVFERDSHTCQYCGATGVKLECDHVVPLSRGGNHDISNLAAACASCNRSKRNKLISEWRKEKA